MGMGPHTRVAAALGACRLSGGGLGVLAASPTPGGWPFSRKEGGQLCRKGERWRQMALLTPLPAWLTPGVLLVAGSGHHSPSPHTGRPHPLREKQCCRPWF